MTLLIFCQNAYILIYSFNKAQNVYSVITKTVQTLIKYLIKTVLTMAGWLRH